MKRKINAMERLNHAILEKNCRIVAGLDPVLENMPAEYLKCITSRSVTAANILFDYSRKYIQAISPIVPAIKINSAFFEQHNASCVYFQAAAYAKECGLFVIGDAKRADIGSTSTAYAEAFLGKDSPFDAVTINPYFGTDGVKPFLDIAMQNNKGIFVLVKTSNPSSKELQNLKLANGKMVFEAVADLVSEWGDYTTNGEYARYNLVGAVVGATHPEEAAMLRKKLPNTFFLVPGYGAQGASAQEVQVNFDDDGFGAIINSSRGIMNAYKNERWKDKYSEETWTKAAFAEACRASAEINSAIFD